MTIPAYIATLSDRKQLKNVMANAKRLGRNDVYWAAFARLCETEGMNYNDPLHREFYAVLAAYELLMSEQKGRTQPAHRTRQKLKRCSVEQCLEDWAVNSQPTQGFLTLTSENKTELTAEHLVVKYADRFAPEVVAAAQKRLDSIAA